MTVWSISWHLIYLLLLSYGFIYQYVNGAIHFGKYFIKAPAKNKATMFMSWWGSAVKAVNNWGLISFIHKNDVFDNSLKGYNFQFDQMSPILD